MKRHVWLLGALLSASLVTGCSKSLLLMGRDGTIAHGTATTAGMGSGPLEVTLKGETYKGRWVHGNVGVGFISGTAGAPFSATAITSGGGSPGSALLQSESGKTLRCYFTYGGMSGMGICEDAEGMQYDLQIS